MIRRWRAKRAFVRWILSETHVNEPGETYIECLASWMDITDGLLTFTFKDYEVDTEIQDTLREWSRRMTT